MLLRLESGRNLSKKRLRCLLSTKKRLALIAIAAGLLTSHAEDIRTLDGKEYKNVTITRAEPDGLVVRASYGIIKIFFTELSAELREKYHYDPEAATKYRQQLDADHR